MTEKAQRPIVLSVLFRPGQVDEPVFLGHYFDAYKVPFPIRSQTAQVAKFTSRKMACELYDGQPLSARYDSIPNLIVHGLRHGNYAAVCIMSEKVAPSRVYRTLRQIIQDQQTAAFCSAKDCDVANVAYYLPMFEQVEKLEQLQQELEETKKLVYYNLEQVISRGKDLEPIYAQAIDLNDDAKLFLKSTKKLRCRCFGM